MRKSREEVSDYQNLCRQLEKVIELMPIVVKKNLIHVPEQYGLCFKLVPILLLFFFCRIALFIRVTMIELLHFLLLSFFFQL